MTELPFENAPEEFRPVVAEVAAKAVDLIKENPELRSVPTKIFGMIFQAGVLAGFEACRSIDGEK